MNSKFSKSLVFSVLVISTIYYVYFFSTNNRNYTDAIKTSNGCDSGMLASIRCRLRRSAKSIIGGGVIGGGGANSNHTARVMQGQWYEGELDTKMLFEERRNTKMYIGLIGHFFNRPDDLFIWEKFIEDLSTCPEMKDKCEFTHDSKRIPTLDVVAIYVRDQFKLVEPANRPAYQKWVYSIIESPVHTYNNLNAIRYKFNTTMTYRMDSDIPYYYGICEKASVNPNPQTPPPPLPANHTYLANKKYPAAWFVHNCAAPSKRKRFVDGLKKHIDIHVYGTCGKYKCSYDNGEFCDKTLLNRDYKFYMALENSFCEGYITEKTFRILDLNVIPVISSHTDLKSRLPPHSYIDTRDFSTYAELAAYMNKVGSDEKLYAEYFAWKREGWRCYKHENYHESVGCRLCRHSWKNRYKIEVADVLTHWNRAATCISGESFYAKYFAKPPPVVTTAAPKKVVPVTTAAPKKVVPVVTTAAPKKVVPVTTAAPKKVVPIVTTAAPKKVVPVVTTAAPKKVVPVVTTAAPKKV